MTTGDDGRNAASQPDDEAAGAAAIRWWDPFDTDSARDRAEVQVELIIEAFGNDGVDVGVHRAPDGTVDYLYRRHMVLARDVDAPRVRRALGIDELQDKADEGVPVREPAGLTMIRIPDDRDVPEVLEGTAEANGLDGLDARLGVGVAVPDHVLHVCPVTWCSVIEPQPRAEGSYVGVASDDEADGRVGLVVVCDTGSLQAVIDEHAWLEGVTGTEEPPTVGHYTGHGTFIAGVVRTYAPESKVHVEAVLSIGGAAFESDVVAGLTRALDLAPDVICLSGGTRSRLDLPLLSFEVFWEERLRHLQGTVLVAAAGNDGDRGPFWPAAFPWTVGVGALDLAGTGRAGYSNHGSWVDVYALGTDVVNAYPKGTYEYQEPPLTGHTAEFPDGLAAWSGTSFATPMVAGLTVARMTWSGESAAGSVESLLEIARNDAGVGTGARLRTATRASRQRS